MWMLLLPDPESRQRQHVILDISMSVLAASLFLE